METRVVETSLGAVEIALTPESGGAAVLVFPGGHTTAATPLGADIYTDLGYQVLTFSRPGYGRTQVGALTAAEFVRCVAEVCDRVGVARAAATVGISFGGLQAAEVAVALPHLAPRLALHSCAPSTLPYPDSGLERAFAPVVFDPRTQRATWRVVRALTSTDRGLQVMMSSLSTLPTGQWWDRWTPADRAAARETFASMDSGAGFVLDLRQGRPDRSSYRVALLRSLRCPTAVTASRHDGGVSYRHAESFGRTIPGARVVEIDARTHFSWLGADRRGLADAVRDLMAT